MSTVLISSMENAQVLTISLHYNLHASKILNENLIGKSSLLLTSRNSRQTKTIKYPIIIPRQSPMQ